MYYNVLKTIKYRNRFFNIYKNKWFINILLKNHLFLYDIFHFNRLKMNITLTKIRNRCILNGKARSIHSKFRLSRFFLKSYSRSGLLNGIKKK